VKIIFFRQAELKSISPETDSVSGLGATETCFINLAANLSKYHTIKVYCPCKAGIYSGVEYIPYTSYTGFIDQCEMFQPDFAIIVGNPLILFKPVHLNKWKYIFWQHNHPLEMKHFPISDLLTKRKIPIVFPSTEAKKYAQKYYKQDTNIFGIYNGVRDEFFVDKNVQRVPNSIMYLGALYRSKGVLELLKIAKELPEYYFNICGGFDMYGDENDEFKDECLSLCGNNVNILGSLNKNEVSIELQKSELCIVNPKIGNLETCCVCALEAMASRTPVISGGKSIIDTIIAHGGVPCVSILSKCIKNLMGNQNTRKSFAEEGYSWVSNLTWDKIALQWWELLDSLKG